MKQEKSEPGYFDWDISGDVIDFKDVAFRMANYTDTSVYNPLSGFSIMGLGMKLSDLQINKTNLNAGIENLKFDLGNGLSVRDMNGQNRFKFGDNQSLILDIETANSRFNLKGLAEGNIFDIIKDPAAMHKANLTIRKTEVSLADIFYFKPDLQKIPGINSMVSGPHKY